MFKGLIQPNESLSGDEQARVVASWRLRAGIYWNAEQLEEPGAVVRVSVSGQGVMDIPSSPNSWNNKAGHGNAFTYTDFNVQRKHGEALGHCLLDFKANAGSKESTVFLCFYFTQGFLVDWSSFVVSCRKARLLSTVDHKDHPSGHSRASAQGNPHLFFIRVAYVCPNAEGWPQFLGWPRFLGQG